jgi:hypothetical protein
LEIAATAAASYILTGERFRSSTLGEYGVYSMKSNEIEPFEKLGHILMMRLLFALGVVAFSLAIGAIGWTADLPRPGQTPTEPHQVARIKAAYAELTAALQRADSGAIASAEADFRVALGPYAGVPESIEKLNRKGQRAARPTPADYRKLTERMGALASGSDRAKQSRMELRQAAYLAIGLLAMSEAELPDANEYRKQAAIELDFLISKQDPKGFFPYPADPIAPPHLQQLAARLAKEYPDSVRNGYIFLEVDGVQFDTGCAAYALGYGYQVLREARFLAAARKAGEWALQFPLSANWNYNAFSLWQLAKLAEISGEPKYVDGAIRIAMQGVLPGQMESGRWSDQHNARAVYHWIMVRALVSLQRVLPADAPERTVIHEKTQLAIQSRVDDIVEHGGIDSADAYAALAEALDIFGPNQQWEQALTEIGGINPYSAGIFALQQAKQKNH